MSELLTEAIAAIKSGDRAAGKQLLIQALNDDPNNDTAWIWMSAVVETDDLRRECLQEALKVNPNNQAAKKGLARLGLPVNAFASPPHLTETEVASFDGPQLRPVSQASRETLAYYAKRLILEKGYVLLAKVNSDGAPNVPLLNEESFNFPVPVEELPELLPLWQFFDIVLFRPTGPGFGVVCMKVRDARSNDSADISQAQLVEIGQACLQYSNAIAYGVVTPIEIQIWEIFERAFTPADAARLQKLKRIPGRKKVAITAWAIDKLSRRLLGYYAPLFMGKLRPAHVRYVERVAREELSFSEEKLLLELSQRGISVLSIILGVIVGLSLGFLARLAYNLAGWSYSYAVDHIICVIAVSIALLTREVRRDNVTQGILAALSFGLVYYLSLPLVSDYRWNIGTLIIIGLFVLWGRLLGSWTEP